VGSTGLLPPPEGGDRPVTAVEADRPAHVFSLSDALALVARAAETIRRVQANADLVDARARELLRVMAPERRRMQGEIQDLQRRLADSEERSAEAEIRLQDAHLRAWNEAIRREEAEGRERGALQRAEEAERRCGELEQLFFQIRARLIPALTSAGVV